MDTKTIGRISNFIATKPRTSLDYQTISFSEVHSNIDYVIANVVTTDYFQDLKDISVDVKLSDNEVLKYRYRPKMLSYDLYGNTELYYIILRLNDLYNIKDFPLSKKHLILTPRDKLRDFLSDVYNADIKYIQQFNDRHRRSSI